MSQIDQELIYVYAHWETLDAPEFMGTLYASPARGKEIFSFEYDKGWLSSAHATQLDPHLQLFQGPQYPAQGHPNFGIFLDSCPDRWGRVLMKRREEQAARSEGRAIKNLLESDFLLGVFDGHRMGALRFKLARDGNFLDDNAQMASPPWVMLRELENASLQLEKDGAENDNEYQRWLQMLIAPGGSLGGARPKASVIDEHNHPWIAKFPSMNDVSDIGLWEFLVHRLARLAGIETSEARVEKFTGRYHTFLTKRFDRSAGKRIHFASAMTMLAQLDGHGDDTHPSYLDMVEFLLRNGSQVEKDLQQLWRRIVFNICVSNTDDHLRNHGFLLTSKGWKLAPAYDMNAAETGNGLTLNISRDDNAQDLELAYSVAPQFRLKPQKAREVAQEIITAVRHWENLTTELHLSKEAHKMRHAFRVAMTA